MILNWIGFTIFFLTIWIKSHRDVHKFQLNGYYQGQYLRWTFGQLNRWIRPYESFVLLGIILYFATNHLALKILSLLFVVLHHYFTHLIKVAYPPVKKLVYTARVKRMLATNFLLIGFISSLVFFLHPFITSALFLFLYVFSPISILAANTLNTPIERAVNRYYMNDAKKILQKNPHLTVIGITGSYGKTSTKNVIYSMLSKDFNTLMTPESYNTPMGLTRTIRQSLKPIHEVFVAEMGAKALGEIKELCEFVKPSLGIITSIGPQHLDTFKTFENIVTTKGELFQYLQPGGTAFINISDPNILNQPRRDDITYVTFTVEETYPEGVEPDYKIEDVLISQNGSSFTLVQTQTKRKIRLNTKLLGRHNLANVVAGAAVAITLGVPMERLVPMTADLTPVDHRLSFRKVNNLYTVLDDAFNSNPVGSKMALEVLKGFEGNKKIIITPGMIELGDQSYALNKAFGEAISQVCDVAILVGRNQTKPIYDGLMEMAYPQDNIIVVQTMSEAFSTLHTFVSKDDVVLIENDLPDTLNQ